MTSSENLISKCEIALERNTLELKEARDARLRNEERIEKLEKKSEFKNSLLTKEEFAALCRVDPITIHRRLKNHMYDIPEGQSERAVYQQGNQGNALFLVPLAMDYFEINTAAKQ